MHVALYFYGPAARLGLRRNAARGRQPGPRARGARAPRDACSRARGRRSPRPASSRSISRPRARPEFDIAPLLPAGLDVLMAFAPARAWRRRCPGSGGWPGTGSPATTGPPNTLYVSADHARRHGGRGVRLQRRGPARIPVPAATRPTTTCSSAGCTSVKGYRWAVEGARRARRRLRAWPADGGPASAGTSGTPAGSAGERRMELLAGAAASGCRRSGTSRARTCCSRR